MVQESGNAGNLKQELMSKLGVGWNQVLLELKGSMSFSQVLVIYLAMMHTKGVYYIIVIIIYYAISIIIRDDKYLKNLEL